MPDEKDELEGTDVEPTDEELQAAIQAELDKQQPEPDDKEPEKDEEEPFDVEAASVRRVMSIEDPAKRRAALEQLAKAEGLELKLPGESKDEQEVAMKVGEKKVARVTAEQMVKDLEAEGFTVDLTSDEIATLDGFATLQSAHSQMQLQKARDEIRAEMEAEKAQADAERQFEDWKLASAKQLAAEHGNAEAAEAVYAEFKDMTPGEVQATMQSPRLAKLMDDRVAQIVKEHTASKVSDEPTPKSEDVGGRGVTSEPTGANKKLYDQLANDPEFADDKEFLNQVRSR